MPIVDEPKPDDTPHWNATLWLVIYFLGAGCVAAAVVSVLTEDVGS